MKPWTWLRPPTGPNSPAAKKPGTVKPKPLRKRAGSERHTQQTAARHFVEDLAAELDELVAVSVLEGADIVFVARAEMRSPLARGIGLGGRLPAFATSMGRVLLADLPPAQARRLLASRTLKA